MILSEHGYETWSVLCARGIGSGCAICQFVSHFDNFEMHAAKMCLDVRLWDRIIQSVIDRNSKLSILAIRLRFDELQALTPIMHRCNSAFLRIDRLDVSLLYDDSQQLDSIVRITQLLSRTMAGNLFLNLESCSLCKQASAFPASCLKALSEFASIRALDAGYLLATRVKYAFHPEACIQVRHSRGSQCRQRSLSGSHRPRKLAHAVPLLLLLMLACLFAFFLALLRSSFAFVLLLPPPLVFLPPPPPLPPSSPHRGRCRAQDACARANIAGPP